MNWQTRWARKETQRIDLFNGQNWELAVIGNYEGANQVRFRFGSPAVFVNKVMSDHLPWLEARERAVSMLQAYIRNCRLIFETIEGDINGTTVVVASTPGNPAHAGEPGHTAGSMDGDREDVHDDGSDQEDPAAQCEDLDSLPGDGGGSLERPE